LAGLRGASFPAVKAFLSGERIEIGVAHGNLISPLSSYIFMADLQFKIIMLYITTIKGSDETITI